MRPLSWLLGVALLAGLALPAVGQDKLPAEEKAGHDVFSVDDVIRQTIAETACCQPPAGPGFHLEAAGEFLLLRPHFDDFSNDAVTFVSGDLSGVDAPEYDLEPAFRFWLAGVLDNGFGVRGRFFHIDANADPVTGVFEFQPPFINTLSTGLEMNVLDVEGTVQRSWCGCLLLASAGLRYAHLERTGDSTQSNNVNLFVVDLQNEFDGFGPTFAVEGRRRLLGNLSGYLNARGSLLLGESDNTINVTVFNNGIESGRVTQSNLTDNSMWVGEIQLGLEWARCLRMGEVFFRAGLEAQYWLDGGHILQGEGAEPASPHDDLTLLGLSLGAGIRR